MARRPETGCSPSIRVQAQHGCTQSAPKPPCGPPGSIPEQSMEAGGMVYTPSHWSTRAIARFIGMGHGLRGDRGLLSSPRLFMWFISRPEKFLAMFCIDLRAI